MLETGDRIGVLEVIGFSHINSNWIKYYHVRCDCGGVKVMRVDALCKAKSCGRCSYHKAGVGTKHNLWTVLEVVDLYYRVCVCECGYIGRVQTAGLLSKSNKSCATCSATKRRTHGKSNWPEYGIWSNMLWRCGPNGTAHYKGRGIAVAREWYSFETFIQDMGRRPPDPPNWLGENAYYSIDRVNNNGDYTPTNCRWATPTEQNNNTRWNT